MRFFDRVRMAAEVLLNRYEGANPSTPERSWIPAFVRDARFDANSFSRWELTRKIRYFERNVWLVQALQREFIKWTVGPNGLPVIPSSSDTDWNERMLESYQEWCESPCLDSTITMSQAHKQMAGESHIDGELFIAKTRSKVSGQASRPAIQLVESHRVSSPGHEWSMAYAQQGIASPSETDRNVVDGVQLGLDSRGKATKPIGYWVRESFEGDAWVFRSVAEVHHVFDPTRVGMYREITPYHACLNTLHDLDDLEAMEMQKAKANSEVANILKNSTGEIPPSMVRRERYLGKAVAPGKADEDFNKRLEMYRKVLGSRTIALKSNEDLAQLTSTNPSAATQWYWRYKIGQICAAQGIPMILIFPEMIESIQGTVVRGIYDNAHEFFRSKFFVFAHAARDVYRYYANWARYNDPRCVDAPADWAKCHVIPPRAVNVDIGRNSAAMLSELAAGTTNYDRVYGMQGSTAEVGLRQKARNVALIKRIAKEEGVEPAEIAAPLGDVLLKLAQAEQADAGGDSTGGNGGNGERVGAAEEEE
jgi:capsid protein